MSKLLLVAAITVGLVGLALAAANKVVVEAEKYGSIVPSMQVATSSLASGGAFIQIPLHRPHATTETGPADQGRTSYSVNIPAAGSYRFWGRTHWHDACGNSFFLKIGNKPEVALGQDGTYQRWHWVKGPIVELAAGPVQVTLRNREDGAKLDQFMFTKNLNYVPVRIEH